MLFLETLGLLLRKRELIRASQRAPGMVPLKKDANAGIEATIIAT